VASLGTDNTEEEEYEGSPSVFSAARRDPSTRCRA
jgi:hypothetical protein